MVWEFNGEKPSRSSMSSAFRAKRFLQFRLRCSFAVDFQQRPLFHVGEPLLGQACPVGQLFSLVRVRPSSPPPQPTPDATAQSSHHLHAPVRGRARVLVRRPHERPAPVLRLPWPRPPPRLIPCEIRPAKPSTSSARISRARPPFHRRPSAARSVAQNWPSASVGADMLPLRTN